MIRLTVALPTVKNYLIIYEMSLKISETAVINEKEKERKKGGLSMFSESRNQEIQKQTLDIFNALVCSGEMWVCQ